MGVSTCHQSICTRRACLSFTCAVPGGLGKARVPPCQDREKKQETRAGPGPPRQHQNVGCSSTWWTASPPPKCHQVPLATTRKLGAPSSWLCLPCHLCGNSSLVPGLGMLQDFGMLRQHRPVDAHAAERAQLHLHMCTAWAESTRRAGAEPAVPPRPALGVLSAPCVCSRG